MFSLKEKSIYVAALDLWIDSLVERDLAYVSHGHADHARPHPRILSSPANAAICQARFERRYADDPTVTWGFEVHAFNEPWRLGEYELTLFPAGHVLGSSQLLLEGESGRAVYTGDFKLETAFTAEAVEVKPCDLLLMECTYGKPQFVFPSRAQVAAEMVGFATQTLSEGITPVFYAYSLGKAQEAMAMLGAANIPLTVHGAVHRMCEVYESSGVMLPTYAPYDGDHFDPASAVIWPPGRNSLPKALRREDARTASLTGWALAGGAMRSQTDAAFPLSDHADYPSILRYVEIAQPKKIVLNHGYREMVQSLRKLGLDAEYLDQHPQLSLF